MQQPDPVQGSQEPDDEARFTDRGLHQLLDDLATTRQHYQDLFEFALDGYLVTDQYGIIKEANRVATIFLGAVSQFLSGTSLASYIAVDDRPRFVNFLDQMQHAPRLQTIEARLTAYEFEPREAMLRVAAFRNPIGQAHHLRWILHDISERKRAETDRAELAHLSAVAHENGRLYREAMTAVAMRNKFLANIVHDLRNPLTVIYGYVQTIRLLTERLPSLQTSNMMSSLDRITDTTMRMMHQLSELTDVTLLQDGQPLDLRAEPTDLVGLVRRVVEEQQRVTDRHRIRFDASVFPLVGRWDGARLERVVMNLIDNAVKYSPNGGEITVFVGTREEEGKSLALLAVHDNGVGIPPGETKRIFEQFHRAPNVLGFIPGWGIGLANVKEIVKQHGGTIEVTSEEGIGSTFTVRLPL